METGGGDGKVNQMQKWYAQTWKTNGGEKLLAELDSNYNEDGSQSSDLEYPGRGIPETTAAELDATPDVTKNKESSNS